MTVLLIVLFTFGLGVGIGVVLGLFIADFYVLTNSRED